MYGSKLTKIGRNSVPEFRPRKVNCGFSGVCSYLLDIICIMVSELMTVYMLTCNAGKTHIVKVLLAPHS